VKVKLIYILVLTFLITTATSVTGFNKQFVLNDINTNETPLFEISNDKEYGIVPEYILDNTKYFREPEWNNGEFNSISISDIGYIKALKEINPLGGKEKKVYPTGDPSIDLPNVQFAVDNFENVKLMAGTFNFGIGTVYITKSVNIEGENKGNVYMTKIVGGGYYWSFDSAFLIDNNLASVNIKNLHFDQPTFSAFKVNNADSVTFKNNKITNTIQNYYGLVMAVFMGDFSITCFINEAIIKNNYINMEGTGASYAATGIYSRNYFDDNTQKIFINNNIVICDTTGVSVGIHPSGCFATHFIENNEIYDGTSGIYITGGVTRNGPMFVTNNKIYNSIEQGIGCHWSEPSVISNNEIVMNGKSVYWSAGIYTVGKKYIEDPGHIFKDNKITGFAGHGVYINGYFGYGREHVVLENDFSGFTAKWSHITLYYGFYGFEPENNYIGFHPDKKEFLGNKLGSLLPDTGYAGIVCMGGDNNQFYIAKKDLDRIIPGSSSLPVHIYCNDMTSNNTFMFEKWDEDLVFWDFGTDNDFYEI
jgi:hypothetical protein